jgi:hypothetical protein
MKRLSVRTSWVHIQQKAFNLLKGKLSSTPMLQFTNFLKLYKVHMDASGFAIGGVLTQDETTNHL